jgi:hypothetical protein
VRGRSAAAATVTTATDAEAAALTLAMRGADADEGFLASVDKFVAVLKGVPVDLVRCAQVPVAVLGDIGFQIGEPALS